MPLKFIKYILQFYAMLFSGFSSPLIGRLLLRLPVTNAAYYNVVRCIIW